MDVPRFLAPFHVLDGRHYARGCAIVGDFSSSTSPTRCSAAEEAMLRGLFACRPCDAAVAAVPTCLFRRREEETDSCLSLISPSSH